MICIITGTGVFSELAPGKAKGDTKDQTALLSGLFHIIYPVQVHQRVDIVIGRVVICLSSTLMANSRNFHYQAARNDLDLLPARTSVWHLEDGWQCHIV
jgi:hypothetical protein